MVCVISLKYATGCQPLTTAGGIVLKEVDDIKYLGSWVNQTEQDLKVRKALHGEPSVWNANLPCQTLLLHNCRVCSMAVNAGRKSQPFRSFLVGVTPGHCRQCLTSARVYM